MRPVRAILIDPFTRSVTEVEHDADDYRNIHRLLSHPTMEVDLFTVVGLGDDESIFVDDEGLLKDPTHFFVWKDYAQPLAGKGLILGCDEEGETIGTKLSLEEVRAKVRFTDKLRLSHFEPIPEHEEDHPVLGKVTVIGHAPVFGVIEKDEAEE